MDVTDIVTAFFNTHLANGFQERQRFDITDRTTDFNQGHISTFGTAFDQMLDLISNVRNHLNGFTQVFTTALFLDHRLVNLAGRKVIALVHTGAGKALIVAEIQVGFCAIFRHEHFTVLEWAHRAGIDVDVGIEL